MDHKDRILATLDHRDPDRIPLDFGATPVTGIHVLALENMRKYWGLPSRPVKVTEPYQMLGEIEEDLADLLEIDSVGVQPRNTMFGFPNEGWKTWRAPWGQELLVPEKFNVTYTERGDVLIYPEGDTSVPPCARMPVNGFFFDAIPRQDPIDHNNLNIADNLEEFSEITDEDLQYFTEEIRKAYQTGKAVVANIGGTGLGDIALVPALQLKHPRGIRDVTEWYMATLMHPDYVKEIFTFQTDIALKNLKRINNAVGEMVDVIFLCGTDFGTQNSQFCSEETLLDMYAPFYKKMISWIHENTSWKVFKHSCGAVEPFIRDFIDFGFDILNPVQVSAAGMAPEHLKKSYGNDIVFWGGGVDTQHVLPFGTPAEVETQVMKHCEIFGAGGGFVFNTVHNLQANVPVENIAAVINALRRFNGQAPL
jgi:uroporphyrinogen-III decarboxylase